MITFQDMPEDNADLAQIDVDFPTLNPDTPDTCPVPLGDLVEYLRRESPDGEAIQPSHLIFLRTALVADHRYWIWSFDESDGASCFATISIAADGTPTLGYDENTYALTPEQFILGDFHEVF